MMRHRLIAFVLAAFGADSLAAQESDIAPAAELPADRRAGAETIEPEQLRAWLGTLASEEFAGRGTGQPGFQKAADLLAGHFRALGLEPAGEDGSYFQVVPWRRESADLENSGVEVIRGQQVVGSVPGHALHGILGTGLEVQGALAVVATDRHDGSDLKGLEMEGLAVLVIARAGLLENPEDRRARRFGPFLAARSASSIRAVVNGCGGKLAAIVSEGAHELLGPFQPRSGPTRRSGGRAGAARGRTPTAVVLSDSEARDLLEAVEAPLPSSLEPASVWAAAEASLQTRVLITAAQAPAMNVCARLPGSDPALTSEHVVVGCHLDHLGVRGGVVHPGADDDGSGTTGLMAIAQAFANNPVVPRRSVLFLAFCGEENGLIGSAYYAANPTVPLGSMVAELQLDMIGRNEENGAETAQDNLDCLHLVGSRKLSNELHQLCVRLNRERAGFALEWDEEGVFYRSDHWNFAREGVPIAFFFTGFHPDYHRPTDTPDKIDYPKLLRIATYVYDLAFELAQTEQRPRVDAELWNSLENKGREQPVAPLRPERR